MLAIRINNARCVFKNTKNKENQPVHRQILIWHDLIIYLYFVVVQIHRGYGHIKYMRTQWDSAAHYYVQSENGKTLDGFITE